LFELFKPTGFHRCEFLEKGFAFFLSITAEVYNVKFEPSFSLQTVADMLISYMMFFSRHRILDTQIGEHLFLGPFGLRFETF
jgi:hypothetical protein